MINKKIEIKLSYPVMIERVDTEGKIITKETDTLSMGRFKVKHLKDLPKEFLEAITKGGAKALGLEQIKTLIPLLASLMEISESEMGEVDVTDLTLIAEKMGEVLKN